MSVLPLILAAGRGTRMGNPDLPKVLSPLAGRPMVSYVLDAVEAAGLPKPVVVVGFKAELVKEALGDRATYVTQAELLGTGHAVMQAEDEYAGAADMVFVTNGDQPCTTPATIQNVIKVHEETGAAVTMATVHSDKAAFMQFGRVLRDERGVFRCIREWKDCTEEEKAVQEYCAALYVFNDEWLWAHLSQLATNNAQNEYYITDLLRMAVDEGAIVSLVDCPEPEAAGVNTPEELARIEALLPA